MFLIPPEKNFGTAANKGNSVNAEKKSPIEQQSGTKSYFFLKCPAWLGQLI